MKRLFSLLAFAGTVVVGGHAQFDCSADHVGDGFEDFPEFVITTSMKEVPGEYSSISEALGAANFGDTIAVAPGTYYEHDLSFDGKEVVLYGIGGSEQCVIDAQGSSRVFDVTNGETYATQIIGFTLQNGNHSTGSAIRIIQNSSMTVSHCRFINNNAPGIWTRACVVIGQSQNNGAHTPAAIHFNDCLFEGNSGYYGASIFNESSGDWQTIITRCIFRENSAYHAPGIFGTRNSIVRNCLFYSNSSSGPINAVIQNEGGHPLIENCTFVSNDHFAIGRGNSTLITQVKNCIFQNVLGPFVQAESSQFDFSHCSFEGAVYGEGSIPGPVALLGEDCGFAPDLDSEAIDAGDPNMLDEFGTTIDIGWISVDQTPLQGCNDPFASNFNAVGDCTYCTPSNAFDSSPSEEFAIGSGLSNDHMNVGIDPCNGITASLGVLERYVGNVEPQAGNLSNYQVNTGFADVPDGGDAGSRWNYLLSVNLGEYVFADVEVKFGLDFDPADDFDADNLEESYTIFGSFAEAWPLVEMVTGVDYPQESIFQDSQNFDFGFWSQLAEGADVDFDPNAVGVYNLGVYVYSLEGTLLASSEISVETLLYAGCTDPDACNYDPDAFEDDDSCIYPVAGGTCDDYCSLALPDTIVQCFNSSTLIEAGVQRGTFFDGVDDWILTSESGVTGMNPMSVSFWALTDHNGAMDIFTQASDDDSWADIRFGMNTPQCGLVGPSFKSPAHFATFPYPVDNRNWHHYAYVLGDGSMSFSNLKIYVDGELHSASTGEEFCGHNWGGWTYDAADVPIRFGVGLPLGGFYSGYLDDMALWSKALSQDDVFEIMANDAMAVSEDLVSFWPLDQLEDGFFLDVVGNNHGAPVGGVGTETPLPQGVVTWFSGSQMPSVVVTPNQTTAYSIQSILESGQVCADTTVVEVIDFEYADLNGNGICDQLEGEGCMDLMACNYSEFALVDDGSCDFSCCPGPGCCSSPNVWDPATQMCVNTAASCGEGTVWDESLQQCLPEDMCFADLDNDGVVGMSDLLDLLARFGLECAD